MASTRSWRKQRLIQEMQKRNAIEAQKIERIKEHIKRLDGNPDEQEREIRERLQAGASR